MQAEQSPSGLVAHNNYEVLEVTVCSDSLMHVVARPAGAPASTAARPWMLDKAQSCPGAPFKFGESSGTATLTTPKLSVSLSEQQGSLTFKMASGETLVREHPNLPRTYLQSDAAGLYHLEDRFDPDATEAIYGLGQHQGGLFNYRGSTVELGQNNTDVAIPLLLSTKGYAILWNTASLSYVDNRFPLNINFESMAGDQVDYYVLYGPEMDRIIHQYRTMTGRAPLLPQWAYGLFQSKDRYSSQTEILDIANQYRARHIPMDAIVQDWFWWTKGGEGDPVFNGNYTDVPAELKTLHDEHVHAMISVWGLLDPNSETYRRSSGRDSKSATRTCTTQPILPRAISSGTNFPASFLRRVGTPSGWTAQSRRSTGRTLATPSCATSSCTLAADWNTRTFFRSRIISAYRSTGNRRPRKSGSSCLRARPSLVSSGWAPPCGQAMSTKAGGPFSARCPRA
jgi:alpha-D-xyloside xylohydrolase